MTHRSHNAMEGHHITSHNIFAQKPINVVYKLVASFRCRRTLKNDIHFRVAVVHCAFSPDAFFVPAIVAFWKNAQMHRSEFHGAANVVSKVWESAFWDLERKYKCQPPFASAIDVLLRAAAAQPTKHVRTIFVCFYVIFACLCVCRRSAIPLRSIISAHFLLALSSSPPNMLCNVSACAARMAEVNVLDCIRTRALRRSRIYRLRSARQNQCDALHHTGTHFRFDPLRVIRALGCFCCHHLHVRRSYVVAYISCRLTDPVRNDEFICVDIEIMLFTVCFFPKYSNKRNTKNRTKWYFWFFFCVFFVVECHSVAKRKTPSYLPHRMGINCFNCTSWMAHQQQQQEQQQRSLWLPCLNSSKRNSSVMSV